MTAVALVAVAGSIQRSMAPSFPKRAPVSGTVTPRTTPRQNRSEESKMERLDGLLGKIESTNGGSMIKQPHGSSMQIEPINGKPKSFPPLSRLIETSLDGTPSAMRRGVDVSWLLDFAVIGFPKCGTTTLMQSLNTPADAAVVQKERCGLGNDHIARLVWQLMEGDALPRDPTVKRGIKCPKNLESPSTLRNLAKYFPQAKLIVTVRHPVLWFQSFYNFRAKNIYPRKMPPTKRMIGGPGICRRAQNVCTDRAKFHKYLAHMAKTPLSSQEEIELLQPGWSRKEIVQTKAKLFLMHVSQLSDKNQTRLHQFREDLRSFTGLEGEIRIESGKIVTEQIIPPKVRKVFINVCSSEHDLVRQVLMKNARKASRWIINYLLKSPDVIVPEREYFIELVRQWELDPCEQNSSGGMHMLSNMTR